DRVLADMLAVENTRLLLSTGLSQVPNPTMIFQHRFIDHAVTLSALGVQDFTVVPRMSRDFLLEFANEAAASAAAARMESFSCGGRPFFTIEPRGASLFCQISYFGAPDGLSAVVEAN